MTRWLLGLTWMATAACVDKPPGAPALTISPASPTSVDDLVATVTGQDGATVVYRWYQDHELQDDLTEDTVSAEHTGRGEIWTVIVAVKKDGTEGVPVGGDVEIGNAAPTVLVSLPPTIQPGGLVTPHVVVSDADDPGEDATLTYAWSNDTNAGTLDTADLGVPPDAEPGTIWTLSVTATDPLGLTGSPGIASIEVIDDAIPDDTGTSGDDTGTSGDDTGTSGDDTGTSGDDTGTSGDDTGAAPEPDCAALGLDGIDDHVQTDHDLETMFGSGDGITAFTMETWFRTETLPSEESYTRILGVSCDYLVVEMDSDGRLNGYSWPDDRSDTRCLSPDGTDYADGDWHHVALVSGTSPGDTKSVYIDGSEICTISISLAMDTGVGAEHIVLGGETPGCVSAGGTITVTGGRLNGAIAGFRLNTTEVYTEGGFTPAYPLTAIGGTRALYNFGEAVADGADAARDAAVVLDGSGRGNDATVAGDANWLDEFAECPAVTDPSACLGISDSCPAVSCQEILEAGSSTGDGIYWLEHSDSTPMRAYCDMTTDGGGWTRVIYAAVAPGASDIYTEASYNRAGCISGEGLCKLSDDEINALLDAHGGTDDRFRLTYDNLTGVGAATDDLFWDTTTPFRYNNADAFSSWWKVADSLGGAHSPGCRHTVARGVGHYRSDSTCEMWGIETHLYHTESSHTGTSPGRASDYNNFSWWVR